MRQGAGCSDKLREALTLLRIKVRLSGLTTRKHCPGRHHMLVNGQLFPIATFTLTR